MSGACTEPVLCDTCSYCNILYGEYYYLCLVRARSLCCVIATVIFYMVNTITYVWCSLCTEHCACELIGGGMRGTSYCNIFTI